MNLEKARKSERRAIAIMDQNTRLADIGREPLLGRKRMVHLVLSYEPVVRAIDFCTALQLSAPKRFLFCVGIPTLEEFTTRVTEAHERGWSGDSCLVVISSHSDKQNWYVLEKAIGRQIPHWKPRNVWVFSKVLPDRESISLDTWKLLIKDWRTGDLFQTSYRHATERMAEQSHRD